MLQSSIETVLCRSPKPPQIARVDYAKEKIILNLFPQKIVCKLIGARIRTPCTILDDSVTFNSFSGWFKVPKKDTLSFFTHKIKRWSDIL